MEPPRITHTVELDADELQRQLRAGIQCGIVAAEGNTQAPFETPEELFREALAMVFMAVKRDCQASANRAMYHEGYGHGLKTARDRRV